MNTMMIAAICAAVVLVLGLLVWVMSKEKKDTFAGCAAAQARPVQCVNSQGYQVLGSEKCKDDTFLRDQMYHMDSIDKREGRGGAQRAQPGMMQRQSDMMRQIDIVPPDTYTIGRQDVEQPAAPAGAITDVVAPAGAIADVVAPAGATTSVIELLREQEMVESGGVVNPSDAVIQSSVVSAFYGRRY